MKRWVALLLVLAACSSTPAPSLPTLVSSSALPSTRPGVLGGIGGYIGYLTSDRNVAVIGPDGSDNRSLTTDSSDRFFYQQPTWSLSEQVLAWTAIEDTESGLRAEVRVAGPAAGTASEIPIGAAPFYFSWSPDGTSLAALAPSAEALDLWIIDPNLGTATPVSAGEPFYFAWSPDSDRLLIHVANARVALLSLGGSSDVVSASSEGYQAPGWSERGELAYVVSDESTVAALAPLAQSTERRRLVVTNSEQESLRVVHSFSGTASFAFSPSGNRLAHSITSEEARAASGVNFGPLTVTDLDVSVTSQVEPDPVVLYQWSPDGLRLLFAVVQGSGSEARLRWRMWEDGEVTDYGSFVPTDHFASAYLPFWDQYALSSRMWSPDGKAFVYAAQDQGRDQVFVQLIAESTPRSIAEGSVAFWSP